ncbi:MAG: biotin-dependent carboxyltransferase family protein [Arenimonas sp.]|jgi:antagonist of KipI
MTLEVLAGGLQTTVQDLGRFGYRHLGVGVAGALDGYSARVANLLVGNLENSAVLEIVLHGPRLRFQQAARIAVTGAELDAQADGIAIAGWRQVDLPDGCELVLGPCRRGARAYLAIAGGIQVPPVLGSASTDLRAAFGGLHGRPLAPGDVLTLNPAPTVGAALAAITAIATKPTIAPWWLDPKPDLDFDTDTPIRLLPGRDAIVPTTALCSDSYRVSAHSNRQGLRLQGPALTLADTSERLSEPVAPGTVQLPADGQPIVLLGEAQTIGGYPRIGHVIAADLPRLAQLRPGDALRFEMIDAPTAHALACAQRQRLTRMALAIEQRRRES